MSKPTITLWLSNEEVPANRKGQGASYYCDEWPALWTHEPVWDSCDGMWMEHGECQLVADCWDERSIMETLVNLIPHKGKCHSISIAIADEGATA